MSSEAIPNVCPVCGYDGLAEQAYDERGGASFEICPSCGTEFGYDDSAATHTELRQRWLAAGARWWSKSQQPPPGWDPRDQLSNLANDR